MDTKLNRILSITIFQIFFIFSLAKSQEFKLRSLDGKNIEVQLHIEEAKHILLITCDHDTAYLAAVLDIKKAELIDKNYLAVVYVLRGGSGLTVAGTTILSVCAGKINQSLAIISEFDEEFLDFSKNTTPPMRATVKSSYDVKLSPSHHVIKPYTIIATVHDKRRSSNPKGHSFNRNFAATLYFDNGQNVFYNLKERLADYYTISDTKSPKDIKKYIQGVFPVVKLGNYRYYYITNVWYERSEGNHLTKYNFR